MTSDSDYQAFGAIRKRSDLTILKALKDGGVYSQAMITEATGLNQSTVSRSLKALTMDAYLTRMNTGHRIKGTWSSILDRLHEEVDAHIQALERVLKDLEGM